MNETTYCISFSQGHHLCWGTWEFGDVQLDVQNLDHHKVMISGLVVCSHGWMRFPSRAGLRSSGEAPRGLDIRWNGHESVKKPAYGLRTA